MMEIEHLPPGWRIEHIDHWPAAMHELELLAKDGWAVRLERAGNDWWCDILGRGEQYRAKAATGPQAIYEAVAMVKGE